MGLLRNLDLESIYPSLDPGWFLSGRVQGEA